MSLKIKIVIGLILFSIQIVGCEDTRISSSLEKSPLSGESRSGQVLSKSNRQPGFFLPQRADFEIESALQKELPDQANFIYFFPQVYFNTYNAELGDTVNLIITGNSYCNFTSSTYLSTNDSNIYVANSTLVSSSRLDVERWVHDYGSTGDKTFTVHNIDSFGNGKNRTFSINSDSTPPSVYSLSPSYVYKGVYNYIHLYGTNTHFNSNYSYITDNSSYLSSYIYYVYSSTHARIRFYPYSFLAAGYYNYTVHTKVIPHLTRVNYLEVTIDIGAGVTKGIKTIEVSDCAPYYYSNCPSTYDVGIPAIDSISPSAVIEGDTVGFTIYGNDYTNFYNSTVTFPDSGGNIEDTNETVINKNQMQTEITVHDYINPGNYKVLVDNCPGDCIDWLSVNSYPAGNEPSVQYARNIYYYDSSVPGIIQGTNTHFTQADTYFTYNCPNIHQEIDVVDQNNQTIQFDFYTTTPNAIASTSCNVEVSTRGEHVYDSIDIIRKPVLDSIDPVSTHHGQVQSFIIEGNSSTDFQNATISIDDPEITISNLQKTNDTLDFDLSINDWSGAPGNKEITVHNCEILENRDCTINFDVTDYPAGTEPLLTLDRYFGYENEVYTITATSPDLSRFYFNSGSTILSTSDLIVNIISHTNNTITFTLQPKPDSAPDLYPLTFKTDLKHVDINFEVRNVPRLKYRPDRGQQGKSYQLHFEGSNTHFDSFTSISFQPGTEITVSNLVVNSATSLDVEFTIDEFTPIAIHEFTVNSGLEEVPGIFEVQKGDPYVELVPHTFNMLTQNNQVTISGHYLDFASGFQVTAPAECNLNLHSRNVISTSQAEFMLDIPLNSALSCQLEIRDQEEAVFSTITINPVYEEDDPGTDFNGQNIEVGEFDYYKFSLNAGDIVKFRTWRSPYTTLDPLMRLAGPDADFSQALALNDDENTATYDSLIVYQAPEDGDYYLRIEDRLGINSGNYDLETGYYDDFMCTELEPNGTLSGADGNLAELLTYGRDFTEDATNYQDCYRIDHLWNYPGFELGLAAVRIIARSLSPWETSGAQTNFTVYDASGVDIFTSSPGEMEPDPHAWISTSAAKYICVEPQEYEGTFYLLNFTPPVLINEVKHTEDASWHGSFIELYGQPGFDFTGCSLDATAMVMLTDSTTGATSLETNLAFSIPLEDNEGLPLQLDQWGYLVVAHDHMVPGYKEAIVKPQMSIAPPPSDGEYKSISIALICEEQNIPILIDQICYSGSELPECTSFVPSVSGDTLGRGYFIDTSRDDHDFIQQIEPSPWQANLTEVK
jgi:hypothetical protein